MSIAGAGEFGGALVNWVALATFSFWLLLGVVFLYRAFAAIARHLDELWPTWMKGRRRLISISLGLSLIGVMFVATIVAIIGGAMSLEEARIASMRP